MVHRRSMEDVKQAQRLPLYLSEDVPYKSHTTTGNTAAKGSISLDALLIKQEVGRVHVGIDFCHWQLEKRLYRITVLMKLNKFMRI